MTGQSTPPPMRQPANSTAPSAPTHSETAAVEQPNHPVMRVERSGTTKGGVAQQVMPEATQKAMDSIQGTVKVNVEVHVDARGAVSEVTVASQGPSKYFAGVALKAAQGWKFQPAIANGQPVASVWELHFQFRNSGAEVIPLEETP
jgi:TonB family protein